MDTQTYIALSIVMFLEYAVWGAWAPVLAARLLGPLKMSGKQTGWIYATLPIASIFMPLIAGWLADRWFNAEWVLIVAHAVGAVLLLIAARQSRFGPMFVVMLLYSMCYAATLPLVNAILFDATSDGGARAKVFLWAPVAWALVGWCLTGWRMTKRETGDGRDCLYLAAMLSVLMVAGSVFVAMASPTAPAGKGFPIEGLLDVIDFNFVVFLGVSLVVFGLMQFYFLGSAQFMQDMGISSKHVPASMALAQIAQALATWFLFATFLDHVGYKGTLAFGAACWVLLYSLYVSGRPSWLMVAIQPFHGLAYVFFVIFGQNFVDTVSPVEIRSTMQALIFTVTSGVGMFLGTQFAGIVMDANAEQGKFNWGKIFAVPAAITLVGVLALFALFHDPVPAAQVPANPDAAVSARDIEP